MDRNELKELILECLAVHEERKPRIKRKRKAAPDPDDPKPVPHIYALSTVWLDCIGAANIGRIGKAFKPLLEVYTPEWIELGIRAYAADLHRDDAIRYASPESFAGKASGFILRNIPSNELTEKEAKLLGQETVLQREHAATLGLLTERARG